MATLCVWPSRYELVLPDGRIIQGGETGTPLSLTVDGVVHEQQFSLATASNLSILDATSSPSAQDVPDFDYLRIDETSQDLFLELQTDADNSIGLELYTVKLRAGAWFELFYDDSYAAYVVNFGGGSVDDIEKLLIRNTSGSTATGHILAIT